MTNPANQLKNGEPSGTSYQDSSNLTKRNNMTTYGYKESYQLPGSTYTTGNLTEGNGGAQNVIN